MVNNNKKNKIIKMIFLIKIYYAISVYRHYKYYKICWLIYISVK